CWSTPSDVDASCFRHSVLRCFFFFQAEDGIRDFHVTGVQTCALPISPTSTPSVATSALASAASKAPSAMNADTYARVGTASVTKRLSPQLCDSYRTLPRRIDHLAKSGKGPGRPLRLRRTRSLSSIPLIRLCAILLLLGCLHLKSL